LATSQVHSSRYSHENKIKTYTFCGRLTDKATRGHVSQHTLKAIVFSFCGLPSGAFKLIPDYRFTIKLSSATSCTILYTICPALAGSLFRPQIIYAASSLNAVSLIRYISSNEIRSIRNLVLDALYRRLKLNTHKRQ
jgi:hypothetical protein